MITYANKADLAFIKAWLEAEYRDNGVSFILNWPSIEEAHENEQLLVLLEDGEAIAFHDHGEKLCPDSIFAVHPEWRRAGIGTELALYLIGRARNSDTALITIDCATTGSEPFWRSLGFEPIESPAGHRSHYAYLPLAKSLALPEFGESVTVTLRFSAGQLLSEQQVEGKLLKDGSVQLLERVVGFSKPTSADIDVEVEIDGTPVGSRSRARYQRSAGFIYRDGAIVVDQLCPSRWEAM